jgi:DNA-binding transcriptional LysR family regulator
VRIGGPDSWPANVGHRYLGSERLIFCAAPGYLARRGTPSAIDDLAAHDAVLYGKADGSTAAWRIAHAAGSVERRVMDGRMVLGEAGSQVAAVLAGCGVAQLATWLLDAPLRDGRLVEVLPRHATDGLALHLVWPRHRALLPRIAALREHLSERLVVR